MAWPTGWGGGTAAGAKGEWPRRRLLRVGLLVVLPSVGGACEPADPARAGAEKFIDRYYVEIDVPAAREQAAGLARAKLDRELALLEGIEGPEVGAKPDVHYRLLEQRPGSDARHRGLLYELTIRLGSDEFVRKTMVTVEEADGRWWVVNFQELD